MITIKHFELDLSIGKIAYLHNGKKSDTKLLCLHGWLDNRASFIPIMPYLHSFECVAIDMIGHGQSSHRDQHSFYHHVDYVRDIELILKALGWQQCHLIGHSMGGAIGLIAASALEASIQSLTMIDILHPLTREPELAPEILRQSIEQFSSWDPLREKVFPSLELATKARLKASPYPQTAQNAQLMMQYGTEKTATGYRLLSDARLSFRSPLMPDSEQVKAFIRAVKQPVLMILADQGMTKTRTDVDDILVLFHDIHLASIKGGHHLHMENPKAVAKACLSFINNN